MPAIDVSSNCPDPPIAEQPPTYVAAAPSFLLLPISTTGWLRLYIVGVLTNCRSDEYVKRIKNNRI